MKIKSRQLSSMLVIAFLASLSTADARSQIHASDGMQALSENRFRVVANDPFLILPIDDSLPASGKASSSVLQIGLNIRYGDSQRFEKSKIPMELFFKPVTSQTDPTDQIIFDPLYRLKFSVLASQFTRLEIPLPTNLLLHSKYIRLDIDQCDQCQLEITQPALLKPQSDLLTDDRSAQVSITDLMNGAHSIPEASLALNTDNWILNDLQLTGTGLQIIGQDPFLVSPQLDLAIGELGGVLLSLDTSVDTSAVFDFQFFYETEKNRFRESMSTLVRVSENNALGAAAASSRKVEFFVPLNFLAEQGQPAQLLRRIRLDFANPVVSNGAIWNINNVKIVNSSEIARYADQTPNQILNRQHGVSSAKKLLKNIVSKINRDVGFMVMYSLLLLLIIIGIVIKFKHAE